MTTNIFQQKDLPDPCYILAYVEPKTYDKIIRAYEKHKKEPGFHPPQGFKYLTKEQMEVLLK